MGYPLNRVQFSRLSKNLARGMTFEDHPFQYIVMLHVRFVLLENTSCFCNISLTYTVGVDQLGN